ncbi:MAG: arylesterase [Desulfobulbaceae bacterium]|nr:arylesterase [Desulfobulbaceae bacterium]
MKRRTFCLSTIFLFWACFLLAACGGSEPVTLSGENIICFGDSLTYGTGAEQNKSYPAQLSAMTDQPVINAGIPGNTTADGLERLETDVLEKSPRIVLITLGGNDLKNGVHKDVAFMNLKTIIEAIQAEGGLVVLGGVKFIILDKGYGEMYKKLAKETDIILIPNILGGLIGKDKYMSDPIHPNGAGYEIMAQKFYKAIEPYL